jgi:preprotein translocase subunit SecD
VEQDDQEENEEFEDDNEDDHANTAHGKSSKMRKLQRKMERNRMKQERKEMNEQHIRAMEQKRELEAKNRRDRDLDREEKELEKREKEDDLKRENQKKVDEEYDQWRHLFEVNAEGEAAADDVTQNDGILSKFIQYIKDEKVISLEDIARKFKMRTEQVIDRIHVLEEQGDLTGLMDDRGKYIYISEEELNKVTQFIENEGRVSIVDLSLESNRLINLNT